MRLRITFFKGIVGVIVLSAIILILLIIFSGNIEFGLVDKNYYEKDLNYQEQIDRIERTRSMHYEVEVQLQDNYINLMFPEGISIKEVSGKIELYRPSDPAMDRIFDIKLDKSTSQRINTTEFEQGVWIVKIYWEEFNLEYYFEKRIFL